MVGRPERGAVGVELNLASLYGGAENLPEFLARPHRDAVSRAAAAQRRAAYLEQALHRAGYAQIILGMLVRFSRDQNANMLYTIFAAFRQIPNLPAVDLMLAAWVVEDACKRIRVGESCRAELEEMIEAYCDPNLGGWDPLRQKFAARLR